MEDRFDVLEVTFDRCYFCGNDDSPMWKVIFSAHDKDLDACLCSECAMHFFGTEEDVC